MDQIQDFAQRLFGGKSAPVPPGPGDDFADFAGAPNPSPVSSVASAATTALADTAKATFGAAVPLSARPYTVWWKVWERVYLTDFITEAFIIPFVIIVVLFHVWGTRKNRSKAKAWAKAHIPVLESEFASVGFDNKKPSGYESAPEEALKKVSEAEYLAYASGRLNTAILDIKLVLAKRYNPLARIGEELMGFFFESLPAPREVIAATAYCFDGSEHMISREQTTEKKEKFKSTFDGFVFAVVHKESMKQLRESRYDLSLTSTKDNAKLPDWATVMSESAEITDALLTPELIDVVRKAGESLEALIITDSPIDRPRSLNELEVKKRVSLSVKVPSDNDYTSVVPLFRYFIRLPDILAERGSFRPEALRRVKETRKAQIEKIKKQDQEEKSEERKLKLEKEKREERDRKLKGMSAEQQRKFVERERAQDMRRGMKSRTVKG